MSSGDRPTSYLLDLDIYCPSADGAGKGATQIADLALLLITERY
jgi:hypothetical protein